MVGKIYEIKNKLIDRIEQDIQQRGIDRVDPQMVDMVKDLAEAEKSCMEAEYYSSVTDAMESYGYAPDDMMGYDGQRSTHVGRSGYRDSMGRYSTRANARRGYSRRMGHMDTMDNIREELRNAPKEERDQLKQELRQMLDM